jgi:hypothetical protein
MAYIGKDLNNLGDVQTLDNITFNAGAGPYNLQKGGVQVTDADTDSIMIAIDGVVQGGNYTVDSTAGTITFDFSVNSSSVCNFVKLFGSGVQNVPKDSSVTNVKLADGSITAAKFSTSGVAAGNVIKVNDAGNAWELGNASSAEVYGFEQYYNPSTLVRTVTVQSVSGSNKYFIDGVQQDTLELYEGNTYVFNYPSGHPFKFSTTSNGTHASGSEYTTGVTHNSSTQVTIVVAASAPTLYYYCSSHSGMGGTANTPTPANNSLRYITTNQGQDNITESQYANFGDVIFSASGFVFSINSNGNLITTI